MYKAVNVSNAYVYFLQLFVHCDTVICDARNPLGGVCNGQCSNQENRIKGMTCHCLSGETNVFCKMAGLRFLFALPTGQRRAVSDGQTFTHVSSGPILVN